MSETKITSWSFSGSRVRTIQFDGELWWFLKDVCTALKIGTYKVEEFIEIIRCLEKDEYMSFEHTNELGRPTKTCVINKSGLYGVVLRSDKSQVKTFKKWIASEVLPTIHKTEKYSRNPDSYMIDAPVKRAECWIEEQQERKQLGDTIVIKKQELNERNNRNFYQKRISENSVFPVLEKEIVIREIFKADICKELGMSNAALTSRLNGRVLFTLREATIIWKTWFNDMNLLELFKYKEND